MLETRTIPAALFGAKCYLIWNRDEPDAPVLVVDPGPGTASTVADELERAGRSAGAILLTHGHVDHIWDAATVSKANGDVPVYLPGPDFIFMDDPVAQLGFSGIDAAQMGLGPWTRPATLTEIGELTFSPVPGVAVRAIPTPGHSPGSAVFLLGSSSQPTPLALSGDVVFAGTVGRTDLPHGDETEMRQSLRTLANVLDPQTLLLPGHGAQTVWAEEMNTNPFVVRARKMG